MLFAQQTYMNKITAAITGVGSYVPENILSNKDLEKIVETSDEWIVSRTGIKERRILKDIDKPTSFMAIKAAEELITKKQLDPLEIDLVILGTATPDMHVAATAAYVASEIGAKNAFGYDLAAACSSFLYGMATGAKFIESGKYKKVLIIGADKMSSIIDYQDRTTCIIFGDGAGAALLEPNHEGLGLLDEYLRSDGVGRDLLNVKAGGSLRPATDSTLASKQHYIRQEGKTVFKHAVSSMANACEQVIKRNNLEKQDIDWLIAHQANKRIIDATARKVGVDDPKKILVNIEKYGNTTSATIPLVLNDFEQQFKKGDTLLFTSFGGGFTWGALYVKWAYDAS